MSDFAKAPVLGGQAMVGPETSNGTGQVYLDASAVRFLSNAEARELAAALIEAADYAAARVTGLGEGPCGRSPGGES